MRSVQSLSQNLITFNFIPEDFSEWYTLEFLNGFHFFGYLHGVIKLKN